MRLFRFMLMTLLLAIVGSAPVAAAPHLAMRLVAESSHPRAGAPVTIALDTRPQPGWHGYWRNPGDAGFPATLAWTLPSGVSAGEPAWPVPSTLTVAGLMNYVYERPYAPLVNLSVPAGLKAGTPLPVRLHATYLVCTASLCVPEEQSLALDLTIGDGAPDPATRGAFDGWRRAIPQPLGSLATYQAQGGRVRIAIPLPAGATADQAYFFPITPGAISYAAPQTVSRAGDRLVVETKGSPRGTVDGVLRIGADRGLAVSARPGVVARGRAGDGTGWLAAFALALLGGLILNVMPCVFPILSLKALSLARSGAGEKEARAEALAYAAGVVLVCVGLGAAILALRAGGAAVGWAFQLQSPAAVLVLLVLTVAIALNLSGLFEVPMPRFAGRDGGSGGAFATGALAAFVATPCTGPFMGAALGAALVLPAIAALAVFAGLGIGLALPFLLIGFVPALRRRLPRPGVWMERLRRILAVPMWLTALALAWVVGRQAGVDGMVLGLAAALAAALALWVAGLRQRRGLGFGWVPGAVVLAVAIAGASFIHRAPAETAAPVGGAEPFSEARLAALQAQHRPVFAYFTADWCLTCKVNEKAAIDTAGVMRSFAAHHVAVLVGDWTDGDPALGRFIEAHNRAGVPLYLYYAPGTTEPRVLPQVLTPGMLEGLAS